MGFRWCGFVGKETPGCPHLKQAQGRLFRRSRDRIERLRSAVDQAGFFATWWKPRMLPSVSLKAAIQPMP
jgi:hypothetical protein